MSERTKYMKKEKREKIWYIRKYGKGFLEKEDREKYWKPSEEQKNE